MEVPRLTTSSQPVTYASKTGQLLWVAHDCFILWNVDTGKQDREVTIGPGKYIGAALSPNGRLAATLLDADSLLQIAKLDTEAKPRQIRTRMVNDLNSKQVFCFSPDSSLILIGATGGIVRQFDLKDNSQAQRNFPGITGSITEVCYSPDGALVAASAQDGKVVIWDSATGKITQEWQMPGAVHGIAFDARGRHLATANANGTVFILRLENPPGAPQAASPGVAWARSFWDRLSQKAKPIRTEIASRERSLRLCSLSVPFGSPPTPEIMFNQSRNS